LGLGDGRHGEEALHHALVDGHVREPAKERAERDVPERVTHRRIQTHTREKNTSFFMFIFVLKKLLEKLDSVAAFAAAPDDVDATDRGGANDHYDDHSAEHKHRLQRVRPNHRFHPSL